MPPIINLNNPQATAKNAKGGLNEAELTTVSNAAQMTALENKAAQLAASPQKTALANRAIGITVHS
jgi:hypothetical protein